MHLAEKQFQASSEAVLDILSESNHWNYEKALGAAIQMHLVFAYAMGMRLSEAQEFYDYVFQSWFPSAVGETKVIRDKEKNNHRQSTVDAFQKQFIRQKENLIEFHDEIWQGLIDEFEFDQHWIAQWSKALSRIRTQLVTNQLQIPKTLLNKNIVSRKETVRLWPIYLSYVHMTNNRLGILNRDEGYIGFLIKSSLAELLNR